MTPPRKPQVRLRYSKLGKIRFTSHRDMARIWERAVRRVGLPIAYSDGFSPRARLSFGLALPTVFESQAEFVDLTLEAPVAAAGLADRLNAALPVGVEVTGVIELTGKVASLQECVEATEWSLFVEPTGGADDMAGWVQQVLAADQLPLTRERKGKSRTDDVRGAILDLSMSPVADVASTCELRALLAAKPRALRPLELLEINAPPCTLVLGRRVNQYIAPEGARRDPLTVGAAQVPHDLGRAS